MPKGTLDAAVDSLIEEVRSKAVGERKDAITVDGRAEVSCQTLDDLRQGRWIDNWMITAAIQMADKPYFIRYHHCVPFDIPGRRGLKCVPRPLAGWRRTVDADREAQHGKNTLVHFCPINLNANHFTLLEINEREEKIYHYDSWASEDVITSGHAKHPRVGKTVEASIDLRL
jgi:hypothetical protein